MTKRKIFSGRLEAAIVIVPAYWTALVLGAGCSSQELAESNTNVLEALGDVASKVAADPTQVATPLGLTVLGATFVLGFFSRQSASVAKWVASTTGGPLVKGLKKILPAKKPPEA